MVSITMCVLIDISFAVLQKSLSLCGELFIYRQEWVEVSCFSNQCTASENTGIQNQGPSVFSGLHSGTFASEYWGGKCNPAQEGGYL